MATNGTVTTTAPEKGFISAIAYRADRKDKDKESKSDKTKHKTLTLKQKRIETNGIIKESDKLPTSGSTSPVVPSFDPETKLSLPDSIPESNAADSIVCKHCKKVIRKNTAKDHIGGCLKSKQEKARKKKEAREAAQRAKERAERGDDDDDDDDDIKDGKGRKAVNGDADGKSKKRKADGELDDKDGPANKKKKSKKEEQKPKQVKTKGPVDVEKQCGVQLPNGQLCARSLTCKSHSMGAKRAVPGRSLPYDMLLAAYQKKNQARQQKAAIDANAPALYDDDLDNMAGPVDSDEERDAVMMAVQKSLTRPQPLVTKTLFPTRRKYQLIRMREMLSNALSGNRGGGLFSVPMDNPKSAYPQSAATENFAIPSAGATSAAGLPQSGMKAPSRRTSIDVT